MKPKYYLWCAAALCLAASPLQAQTAVLADWTFETTQPGIVDGPAIPGAGNWITNIAPEIGGGSASGTHSSPTTNSTPAGNGSSHSFSSTDWSVNDCYQFAVSTLGYSNIVVTYDQVSSGTGPGQFNFMYSTDGVTFTQLGSTYTVLSSPSWSSGSHTSSESYTNSFAAIPDVNNTSVVYFRLVDAGTTSANGGTVGIAGTDRVDNFVVSATPLPNATAPTNVVVAPDSIVTNAGNTVAFTVSAAGSPATYTWFKNPSVTPIAGATNAMLTLPGVTGADSGSYYVVLTNAGGSATSSIVTLSVNDPFFTSQPGSVFGLVGGSAQFAATAAGSGLTYQWYYADNSGDALSAVSDGTLPDGSVLTGAATSSLAWTNLQIGDATNFVLVATGAYGSVTSSVASLFSVDTSAILAFWNFNGSLFNNSTPSSYFGAGTASLVNLAPYVTTVQDPADGAGLLGIFGLNLPNNTWGTSGYPSGTSNKLSGVQFNISTKGAKNISLSYDSRVSPTASDYERVQYTTNGTDWIDYPISSTFNGVAGTGNGGFLPFTNSFAGFPNVENNPNFGVRIVTEFQSTATYGAGIGDVVTTNYVGTANGYATGGTVTYDIVTVYGEAITNNNTPPTIGGFTDITMADNTTTNVSFTVGDLETPANALTVTAVSLNPNTVYPTFAIGGTGTNRTLGITPNLIQDTVDAGPILVTVTDGNGDSTVAWFNLTLTSENRPPTNSLTALTVTNMLANSTVTIPFTVGDDRTTNLANLSYSVNSGNNSVIPSGNITVNNTDPANPTLTITPMTNQLGVAKVSVTVYDNDSVEPKSTTANIEMMVRPNTNVVLVDYFNYDSGGSLDSVAGGFWYHLSGITGQLQTGSGAAIVDTLDNTENLQAQLLGSPYMAGGTDVLYASFVVTMDPTRLPLANGSYFGVFNDGSGVTGNYECRIMAATNGAAAGFYRIGINNFGADATSAQMFPLDLSPYQSYVVVTALAVSNGFSTLWVSPANAASTNVTDTTTSTNLYNISDFELRESGKNAGSVAVSHLKIGTTFDSVFPTLNIQPGGTNVVLTWSDPTLYLQAATNVAGPYVTIPGATPPYSNYVGSNAAVFFKLSQ